MFSGNKFARATGRGQFRPPTSQGLAPLRQRQPSTKKTSLGTGKGITASASAGNGGIANISREESFQLMPHPTTVELPFAMVIRLQPEILEELKQAEADGIEPEMKFGTNALGHVIQIGTETFKFQSAPEPGHLCDIYEQRKGESGDAFLVEAGSAWRKLSVLRILSATEKDRVKKRTAEAEKKQRQRKSILVDPSTQMIIPQAATAEANGRKPLPKLTKEPPPKKRTVTMSPIKQNVHASMTGSHQFSSPASPTFEPPAIQVRGPHMNQMADMHASKALAVPERIVAPPLTNKGPAILKDKTRTPVVPAPPESGKSGATTNMMDLRNFLIGLMQENPKGVTMKAIEKAVTEGLPAVPEKKILDVMKLIATYHAPGKYILNPGVEKGNIFDSVPPSSSGRAQEAVRSSIHKEEPSNSILEREAAKEKKEPTSFDRGLSNVVPHQPEHTTKDASPELVGAQVFDSNIQDDLPKQAAVHISKDLSTGGSESSSSSGSGSASDSDSESSGSGSGTDSGSGSDSGSASSSSSGGASMDEDVDIMSDDDVEKNSDAKQKPMKVRELKSVAKEDVKAQEKSNFKEEGYENSSPLNCSKPATTLDPAKDCGSDEKAMVAENIIETVFGRDEVSDSAHDNLGEHVRGEQSSHIKLANVNYGERKAPVKTQNSRELRERNTFDESQRSTTRDGEALGLDEKLDLLVDKVSDFKEMDNSSLVGNRVGFLSAQPEHHKPPLKSVGLGITKDIDKKRADSECISRPNMDRRERDASNGKWALKNSSSLEMSKMLPEGSPMDAGDHLQNVAKAPENKQQASVEVKRATSKKLTVRESHEKFERDKASDIVARNKSPSNMARASHGTTNAFEGSMKLDDERGVPVDRISCKGGAEASNVLEAKQPKKERGPEERMSDGAKFSDNSGRQSRDYEMQLWHQRDGSAHLGPSKLNLHDVSKESNHSGGGHDRDSPHVDRSNKVLRLSRQKGEPLERAGLIVEQAERPLTDMEPTKRGKDITGKSTLKEAELVGRLPSREHSNLPSKDASRLATIYGDSGHSSYSHNRNQTWENSRIVSQGAELQDPPFENGYLESRKWPPHMEDSRSKATSGATSRVLQKGSSSPDQDDIDRRSLDMSKQSPVKDKNESSRQYAYDSRSGKRRPEEIESSETERSKKRACTPHMKQLPEKEEWFPPGSVKQNHTEKGRFSASNSQEYASVRSDGEMEELYRQQKVSQTRVSSSEFRRDHFKAGDYLDNTKRHTPHSNDEDLCEFFAPYEKKKPDLRGLIKTFQEYKEYSKEYHDKYLIYTRLNDTIEQQKKPFESFKKDIERAKFKGDERKLLHTNGKVRKEYNLCHKNCKRMVHTFRILHDELKVIKTRCKEYAEKMGEG